MAAVPSRRQQCPTHAWCTSVGRGHRTHVGEVQVITTSQRTRLRLSLVAENDNPPVVHIEATFAAEEPLMEIAELAPAEAVQLAGILLRLARSAHGSGDVEQQAGRQDR